jgi:hypothetical protein
MFAIDFEYYNAESGIYETDTFECDNSFNEFKAWLEDNDITNYTIIEIRPYKD